MTENLNIETSITTIKRFITGKLLASGLSGYVVGISGGVDSAVSASLAAAAVGSTKVLGVSMPHQTSSESSRTDAKRLAERLGIDLRTVDITPMVGALYPTIAAPQRVRAGNLMARCRMAVLFDIAAETDRLVLGTGNRTEICLGYTTWYGDSACSVNPIGELYKTEIVQLARALGVPDEIIGKQPSADLWVGQTDEGEIGLSYDTMDALLKRLVDDGVSSMSAFEDEGLAVADVSRVVSLLNRNAFKRALPEVAPLGRRPIPQHIQVSA